MKKTKLNIKQKIQKRIEIQNQSLVFINKKTTGKDKQKIYTESKPVKQNVVNNFNKIFLEPYEKKCVVDYDAVIVIASYDRFIKLNRILTQLYEQPTKYKIKVIVYNDGSTDLYYNKLKNIFPEIDYIIGEVNNGKYNYWKTITTLFKKSSEYISHVVIEIDDDFFLSNNFIDTLIDKFFEGKNISNKNVAIYYHITAGAVDTWKSTNRVDGGILFDTTFLEKINYTIEPISEKRWKANKELGSGVWNQISSKIINNGLSTYKLENSLAKHDGNDDSKMNKSQRDKSPIYTAKFKED